MNFIEDTNFVNGHFQAMQKELQSLFGEFKHGYIFGGITFSESGPQTLLLETYSQVNIILAHSCYDEINKAINEEELIFELSHESCHLLSPTTWKNVTWLEEGMATYFSVYYHNIAYPGSDYAINALYFQGHERYLEAYFLVKNIMDKYPCTIRDIRKNAPQISEITMSDFFKVNFNIEEDVIKKLLSKFN